MPSGKSITLVWYAGGCVRGAVSLRIQQLGVHLLPKRACFVQLPATTSLLLCRCETKTKDNVFVNVVVSVQYQVRLISPCCVYSVVVSDQAAVCTELASGEQFEFAGAA